MEWTHDRKNIMQMVEWQKSFVWIEKWNQGVLNTITWYKCLLTTRCSPLSYRHAVLHNNVLQIVNVCLNLNSFQRVNLHLSDNTTVFYVVNLSNIDLFSVSYRPCCTYNLTMHFQYYLTLFIIFRLHVISPAWFILRPKT